MSWLLPKRFAFSRAEFKDDDDAEAHCTAVGFTFPPVFCWRRAGCEMKRGIRSGAAHVESSHSATPPALVGSMAAAVFLPPSPHPHPRLGQRVLVSSINSRLAKHFFTRFQRAAARSRSTSSSTSSSNRTPEYTTYLWISMILSTDAHTLYAPPPVVAANALPNKFCYMYAPMHPRALCAHTRARNEFNTGLPSSERLLQQPFQASDLFLLLRQRFLL